MIVDIDNLGDGLFNFNGGHLEITMDPISVNDTFTVVPGSGITLNSSTVRFNNNNIGTLSDLTSVFGIRIDFNTDNATTLAVSTLMQQIQYTGVGCSSSDPSAYPITITFDDGGNFGSGTTVSATEDVVLDPN